MSVSCPRHVFHSLLSVVLPLRVLLLGVHVHSQTYGHSTLLGVSTAMPGSHGGPILSPVASGGCEKLLGVKKMQYKWLRQHYHHHRNLYFRSTCLFRSGCRLREQSELFFYEDAFADPAAWHRLWFDFVGLRVPDSVVQDATNASVRQEFSFPTKGGLDKHPGSHTPEAAANATRSYTDDLQQDTVNMMDDIARQWLPPALLEKFGLEKIAG